MKNSLSSLISLRFITWFIAFLLIFLWFDIEWCMVTTFTPFTDYMTLYIILPIAAWLFALPVVFVRKRILPMVLGALLSCFLVANLLYCRTYFTQIPLSSYGLVGNLNGFWDSVTDSFRILDLGYVLIILTAFFIDKAIKPVNFRFKATYLALGLGGVGIAYASFAARGGFVARMNQLYSSVGQQSCPTPVYTPFLPLLYEYITQENPLSDADRNKIESWIEKHDEHIAGYEGLAVTDSLKPRNIVFIMAESMESWPIGLKIGGRDVTPFINSLIGDSTVYFNPNVRTQTRNGRSIDAQLLYLAGRYPLNQGVYSIRYADRSYTALPSIVRDKGGSTFLVTSDDETTWNQGPIAHAFGIDTIYSKRYWTDDILALTDIKYEIHDHILFDNTVKLMNENKVLGGSNGGFMMVVTHTGHAPFDKYPETYSFPLPGEMPAILRDYITTASYVDSALCNFVGYLRKRPDADKTMIVIAGDHEGLASWRNELAANYDFVDPAQHTPLIVINSPLCATDSTEMAQVDVFSTILDLSGLYGDSSWKGMGYSPFNPQLSLSAINRDEDQNVGDMLLKSYR